MFRHGPRLVPGGYEEKEFVEVENGGLTEAGGGCKEIGRYTILD